MMIFSDTSAGSFCFIYTEMSSKLIKYLFFPCYKISKNLKNKIAGSCDTTIKIMVKSFCVAKQ